MNSILLVLTSCLALGLAQHDALHECLHHCGDDRDCAAHCYEHHGRQERQLCFLPSPCDPFDAACIAFCGQKRQVDDLQSCLRYCNGDRACSARCEDAFSERVLRQVLCFLPCAIGDQACIDVCGGVGKRQFDDLDSCIEYCNGHQSCIDKCNSVFV